MAALKRLASSVAASIAAVVLVASADAQVVDGVKYECVDGVCRIVEDAGPIGDANVDGWRVAQGYMGSDEFISFLKGEEGSAPQSDSPFSGGLLAAVVVAIVGGLAMNLTPCVLPMVPVNLMVIGRSAVRGLMYALGIVLAYGTMGTIAALGGMAFGEVQGSPWFNAGVCIVFVLLAFAAAGAFSIDFSKRRGELVRKVPAGLPLLFAFLMGVVGAVLAGACVAPVLVGVLALTARMYASDGAVALALPFAFGLGMALPWPFLGVGLKVLPKPGAWTRAVNFVIAAAILALAAWHGRLAWLGFSRASSSSGGDADATPSTIEARLSELGEGTRPVLVDCWATWCKNCSAMERVMAEPRVKAELERFTVIRLQAEDVSQLRRIRGFGGIQGLPAFVVIE